MIFKDNTCFYIVFFFLIQLLFVPKANSQLAFYDSATLNQTRLSDIVSYLGYTDLRCLPNSNPSWENVIIRYSGRRRRPHRILSIDPSYTQLYLDGVQGSKVKPKHARNREISDYGLTSFSARKEKYGAYFNWPRNLLVISLKSYKSVGKQDIYVSFKQEKKNGWSDLIHLGDNVNSINREINPFITDDGKVVIFSSNGLNAAKYNGEEDYDLYYTVRLDNTYKRWSDPVPLTLLNTSDTEYGIRYSKKRGVLLDHVSSIKFNNIGRHIKSKDLSTEELIRLLEANSGYDSIPNRLLSDGSLLANICTYSQDDLKPLNSALLWIELGRSKIFSEEKNRHFFYVRTDSSYQIRISSPGYYPVDTSLLITEPYTTARVFYLRKIRIGDKISIDNVLFKQSKAELIKNKSDDYLDQIVYLLLENQGLKIRIEGHTDDQGDATRNLILSQLRVERIKEFLLEEGVSESQVLTMAFGESRPAEDNNSEQGRKLNRRVEFKVVGLDP